MNPTEEILDAAASGDAARVRALLTVGPELARAADDLGRTALHWAAEKDRLEVAKALLEAGADIEARTTWGSTPFEWAANMGSTRVAGLLVSRGARGMNVVWAASLGELDLVRRFVEEGPLEGRQPLPKKPDDHWPAVSAYMKGDVLGDALYGACRNGHPRVAAYLLERGVDPDARGVFGGTALHWAAINGHREIVEILLSRGANRTLPDAKLGATPAQWAEEGQHPEIAALIGGGT